jgi:hypothetical protein
MFSRFVSLNIGRQLLAALPSALCVPCLGVVLFLPLQWAGRAQRQDRLIALARLDAVVHYFHPIAATRSSLWDSAFAEYAVRIADAPTRSALR